MDFTAIDFETANYTRASACAIGIVIVRKSRVVKEIYHLIRPPDMFFHPVNVRIHGITPQDVLNEPDFAELWPEIRQYFEESPVVAHSAVFDISVLRRTLDHYGIAYPRTEYSCTCMMSRRHWPYLENHRLDSVARLLSIEFCHHHALEDASACAQIAAHLAREYKSESFYQLIECLGLSAKAI